VPAPHDTQLEDRTDPQLPAGARDRRSVIDQHRLGDPSVAKRSQPIGLDQVNVSAVAGRQGKTAEHTSDERH